MQFYPPYPLKESLDAVIEVFDEQAKRLVVCAGKKGASAWFSALSLKKYGNNINKSEFKGVLCLMVGLFRICRIIVHLASKIVWTMFLRVKGRVCVYETQCFKGH